MKFRVHGNADLPKLVLVHGGGLSWWSWQPVIDLLVDDYCVVTPIIDGHGEAGNSTFISIEHCALELINWLDQHCNGHVTLLGGLSIGAQIVTEVLSLRPEMCEHAIIESALIEKIPGIRMMAGPTYGMMYGLIKNRSFAKLQAKALLLPENMFEDYYQDSMKMSKASLVNMTISNGEYQVKPSLVDCRAKVVVVVGEKEPGMMRRSATKLHELLTDSDLMVIDKAGHGEFSLQRCCVYVGLIRQIISRD